MKRRSVSILFIAAYLPSVAHSLLLLTWKQQKASVSTATARSGVLVLAATRCLGSRLSTAQIAALGASNQNSGDDGSLPKNFNPFSNQQGTSQSTPSPSRRDGVGDVKSVISLRRMRMKEITQQLLDVAEMPGRGSDDEMMLRVLQDNVDFLLEPLEDEDAVLEPDSVIQGDMKRAERYRAYRESMQERISKARNPSAKTVLTALRDFVVSHE